MYGMFAISSQNFVDLNLSGFDFSHVTGASLGLVRCPNLKLNMNIGSRIRFITAPIIIHFIVYFGAPSALIIDVNAGHISWKGIPKAIILR